MNSARTTIISILLLCMHRSLAFSSLRILRNHYRPLGQVIGGRFSHKPAFTCRNLANTFTMDAATNKQEEEEDIPFTDDDDVGEVLDVEEVEGAATADYSNNTYKELTSKFTTEDSLDIDTLQKGIPDKFYILSHASMPSGGFSMSDIQHAFSPEEIQRLKLQPENVTVPAALILLFPDHFTTQTRARKESRKRKILLHKGALTDGKFDRDKLKIAKVGDRVVPGFILAVQARMEHNYSESANHHKTPPFHLPVVYEDDYFALVNKPEGIVTFGPKGGGYGRMTVKSCLPWVITPPKLGVVSVLRRPTPVHRIDRGTSGLLVVAKTKPAIVELSRMFKERKAKKTYTAIVNGDILEPKDTSISNEEAEKLGVCIGDDDDVVESRKRKWQVIDNELEDQNAVTVWRRVKQYTGIENARNNTLSMVELKPKTGRYHQLRRHMAWTGNCPLLGDKTYDGGGPARLLRENGFYLCSNKIVIEHPFYNSPQGRSMWEKVKEDEIKKCNDHKENIRIAEESDGRVLVYAEIDLPSKFNELTDLMGENSAAAAECKDEVA
mmetsp:Transcript_15843/g.23989  ORF Transcript_15843/g.23989 Transcript_15843/m.23989 type:complete len:553 (-) Transcript_15843:6-1664(-)